jgi:hypothetical protein
MTRAVLALLFVAAGSLQAADLALSGATVYGADAPLVAAPIIDKP